jgi:hypothetical protein
MEKEDIIPLNSNQKEKLIYSTFDGLTVRASFPEEFRSDIFWWNSR